ncbi:uncharacterized protein K452DRAFT_241929 [Aplosporella prunicola CBS 121167]|uniref:PHD finger and BAH domain protein n=1 Tax=Aplosporella prunicola CBS 121167 TaxID=1176127 RepID=A0A6A6BUB5_9PEZI|nr:uncharacterized protein K452DRAFT_241929 [Aplosporella prunicola CBS 121167]KAF2146814.1 hypothetical protein K452DRAFT_241929 [Aplosporella prunicola CBS 121167]
MVHGDHEGGGGSSFRAVNHADPGSASSGNAAQPGALHADSMQGLAPTTNGNTPGLESQQRSASHSSTSHLSGERNAQPPQAATSSTPLPPAISQPMAASTSTSSHASAKDDAPPAASGYGTRSRNRPGTTRPNYAEDVEMDFEAPAANGNNSSPSERTTRSPAGGLDGQSPAPTTKKPVAGTNGTTASSAVSRDSSIPGTSTFSANPNANTSATQGKKRKAGGAHATKDHVATAVATPAAATRRNNTSMSSHVDRESNMMFFEQSGSILTKDGKLVADDGTALSVDDHVYLVCEPPGEPYYLCRIMEFLHVNSDNPNSPVDSIRVNWYYRPRDVLRYNNDTRLVYGTMHSDICPLTSLRGKCDIRHRSEVADLDEFRRTKDCFWFNQVFDRFIHRWYEVIPVSQVINVPEKVKRALDERWKFVVVETSRVKELTSAVKTCKRCVGYCAANDSVECAVCHNTYHMNCVRPPLLKKPSRGFAWACGPCGRAQERKLEARRTPIIGEAAASQEEEDILEEEEEDAGALINTTAPSPSGSDAPVDDHPATQAEIALAKMWPMRYLGIHCRVEDALQYDDRAIYPRASSRLGPRHQANVNVWHGRPVELVKPAEIKRRYVKSASHKKDAKLSRETVAALEADRQEKAKRPKWVQDEPVGYVRRGEDHPNGDPNCTARSLFKMPPENMRGEDDAPVDREKLVDDYMERAKNEAAAVIGVEKYSTNFLTKAIELFYANNYDADAALDQLKKIHRRKDLREPEPNKEEKKRFEEGVAKYGSELRNVRLHVRTMSHADVVRYYYMWKKTDKGKQIWGSYDGRKGKSAKIVDSASKLVDDIADDQDDSAFDAGKAAMRKKQFVCKFCSTRHSRQWRRAPGVAPGQTVLADGRSKEKGTALVPGLCQRCARLWRKYAIKYEEAEELIKKVSAGGGKKWRRMIDQELMDEINAAQNAPTDTIPSIETNSEIPHGTAEPPRKKQKGFSILEKDSAQQSSAEPASKKQREKAVPPPKVPTPPPQPVMPKMRELPCAVCLQMEPLGEQRLVCKECRLTVHRQCYGVIESRSGKWVCDQCKNDKKETVSFTYECVLCPIKETEQELIEPPKVSHKKKTDREREKERLEKELRVQKLKDYQQAQRDRGRPELPREPLKKTSENNWVHLHCAVWTPELKFTDPAKYEEVEGVGSPTIRYDQVCKICKTTNGACVSCHQCHAVFHIGCAHNAGYNFGFDVTPVKSSRRDAVPTFVLGPETGSLTAAVWCKDHTPKTIVHPLNEVVDGAGTTALQLYVQNYKRADPTLTGTARKANLLDQFTKSIPAPVKEVPTPVNRRTSTAQSTGIRTARNSSAGLPTKAEEQDTRSLKDVPAERVDRNCEICEIGVSPKWWKAEESQMPGTSPDQPVNTVEGVSPAPPAQQDAGPRFPNGIMNVDTPTNVVDGAGPTSKASTPDGIPLPRPGTYLCNKCHWRRKHRPDLLKPPKKEPTPPPQLPVRSPPRQFAPAPPPWLPMAGTPAAHPPAPLPPWMSHQAPPSSNGVSHSPAPPPHGLPLHQPYHPVGVPPHHSHAPNGYPAYSGPPQGVLPPSQPGAPIRSPYPPPTVPTSLHHAQSPMIQGLPNGLHSPHVTQLGSPAPGHIPPPRQTESPFAGLYSATHGGPGSHGSPGPMHNRPSTPRDGVMPPSGASGASASPNLRNLLH